MPTRAFLVFGAFCVSVLMWVDRACISAAKGDMASDLSFSDSQMGWVMAAFSLGYALFQVPSGHLADRYGPRKVMSVVCIAWSFFTMMTGVVRAFVPMVLLRFCFGMGESGGYPTLARAFSSWLPMNERGITNSISFSGGRLGAALAMPGVVWLMSTLGGWQQAFFFFGAIGFVFAILWFLLFRDTPEEHFAVSDSERDYIVQSRTTAPVDELETSEDGSGERIVTQSETEQPIRFAQMLRSPNMLMLMIQYVAHNFTFFFTVSWFFPYLKETYSLSKEQTALYAAAPLLCGVLGIGLLDLPSIDFFRQASGSYHDAYPPRSDLCWEPLEW